GNAGGGGLYLWRGDSSVTLSTVEVTNTVIADNRIDPGQGTTPSGGGGGLQVQGLVAHLSHVTFAGNQLGTGLTAGQAAVVVESGPPTALAAGTLNLDYSVVANHTASTAGATALVVIKGSTLNLNVGAFSGNTKDINTTGIPAGTIPALATMTPIAFPGFVFAGSPNYDYHLTSV